MANRTVSIWKHVKIGGKWRFCAIYQNPKNHILEGNKVLVSGKVIEHTEGSFYISWYDRWWQHTPQQSKCESCGQWSCQP